MPVQYETWVDGMNRGDRSAADAAFAPNCVVHLTGVPQPILGVEAWKDTVRAFLVAFPDIHFTIEDRIDSGDRVAMRWHARATHKGPLRPLPATGRSIEIDGLIFDRIENGMIVERWEQLDQTMILQQLGVQ